MFGRRTPTATESAAKDSMVFTVDGMHCGNCGLTIDEAVEDVVGVARARTSFRSGTTEVILAAGAVKAEVARDVVRAIAGAGYVAARADG